MRFLKGTKNTLSSRFRTRNWVTLMPEAKDLLLNLRSIWPVDILFLHLSLNPVEYECQSLDKLPQTWWQGQGQSST